MSHNNGSTKRTKEGEVQVCKQLGLSVHRSCVCVIRLCVSHVLFVR